MFKFLSGGARVFVTCAFILCASALVKGQTPAAQNTPAFDQWSDTFDGEQLDETKWERFSFEGAGGKLEVKDGQLRIRSMSGSRAGVRSKAKFAGDFSVEARIAKVGEQQPEPGKKSSNLGFAALTILFDGAGRNRIEWIFTSEGTFQAWSVVDGRAERLDNGKLGTKLKTPVIAIVRRGDEFLFILNAPDSPAQAAQIGLQKSIRGLPRSFRLMLYGFGTSENDWEEVRVVTKK